MSNKVRLKFDMGEGAGDLLDMNSLHRGCAYINTTNDDIFVMSHCGNNVIIMCSDDYQSMFIVKQIESYDSYFLGGCEAIYREFEGLTVSIKV